VQENAGRKEIRLTLVAICVASVASIFFLWDLGFVVTAAVRRGDFLLAGMAGLFAGIVPAFLYGNLAYFVSRIGCLMRHSEQPHELTEGLLSIYDKDPPSVAVLVPSYKEEERVVSRALLSASLSEYPNKRIVLLIDDAPHPETAADAQALAHMRELPKRLQRLLGPIRDEFYGELSAYLRRVKSSAPDVVTEARRLSGLYRRAAQWLEARGDEWAVQSHIDAFFVERVFREPAHQHRLRANGLETVAGLKEATLLREYRRLAGLFNAEFSHFEAS
jgi:cellulose synthase/poly-beta-1,6-N-acetylglucosamine synthase-like glycosyltransferase